VYAYDYEKQFPYTPNVRGVRTDQYKYIHYPHGDGTTDRHQPELYDLVNDPDERVNRAADPAMAQVRSRLEKRLGELKAEIGLIPDRMPIDMGIGQALPDPKIR
jgi:N-acetylglucosamine-6-sulfatase